MSTSLNPSRHFARHCLANYLGLITNYSCASKTKRLDNSIEKNGNKIYDYKDELETKRANGVIDYPKKKRMVGVWK